MAVMADELPSTPLGSVAAREVLTTSNVQLRHPVNVAFCLGL